MKILRMIRVPIVLTLVLMIICGFLYPMLMTGASQLLFPNKANGSIIYENGKAIGSKLVGQDFKDARFMRCRPSAYNYNTYTKEQAASGEYASVASGSNNFAPSNPALSERVKADIDEFLAEHPQLLAADIPTDLLTASGSGLDPDISPASAEIQLPQLAKNTGISEERLQKFVKENTEEKLLGVFGERRVNVLGVNIAIAKELKLI